MQLLTFTLGAGLPVVASSFASGPVDISPRFAFVSKHPYRKAVDTYPLRTPIGLTPMSLVKDSDDTLLTPETYADSKSAENQVENVIMDVAAEAFQSTDFTSQPHLPPELENCEVTYAGEEDENSTVPSSPQKESFQRLLLAQQFAYNTKQAAPVVSDEHDASTKQEAFQRSLLDARLSKDTAGEEEEEEGEEEDVANENDSHVSLMESKVSTTPLGGNGSSPTNLKDVEVAEVATTKAKPAYLHELAAAKNKIGVTPLVADKVVKTTSGRRSSKQPDDITIQSYVTQRGVEQTKERMRQKLGVGATTDNKEAPVNSKGFVVKEMSADKEDSVTNYLSAGEKSVAQTAIQQFLQTRSVQRLRKPKTMIISILFTVFCRSLALAWFGNPAMRLR